MVSNQILFRKPRQFFHRFRQAFFEVRRLEAEARANEERLRVREQAIVKYLADNRVRKLQLGSSENILEGWLCTDLYPPDARVVFLDAAKRFPFDDSTFHYVYSEHMIEHLPHEQGLSMLRECNRIIKRGGRIRVATPDLRVVAGLCAKDLDAEQRRYLDWATKEFLPAGRPDRPAFVVNNLFRAWGHQFLYDEASLRDSLAAAGFTEIQRCEIQQSDDPILRGIESHGKHIGEENNRFETFVLEARRP